MSRPTRDVVSSATDRDRALFKALSDPLRHRILIALDEREASPKELAEQLGEKLEKISYHVRYLAGKTPASKTPLIELTGLDSRRGGTMHYYKAIARPILDTPEAAHLPRAVREEGSASILDLVRRDIDAAVAAGTFDSDPARSLLRMHIQVDPEGLKETGEAAMRYLAELREIEGRSVQRIAGTVAVTTRLATATLAFPLPSGRKSSY